MHIKVVSNDWNGYYKEGKGYKIIVQMKGEGSSFDGENLKKIHQPLGVEMY